MALTLLIKVWQSLLKESLKCSNRPSTQNNTESLVSISSSSKLNLTQQMISRRILFWKKLS